MRARRFPRVRQQDGTDCGAACLASISRHYGVHVPIARIRQFAGTDHGGTSLTGLIRAAERLGLSARGVRAPVDVLEAIPTPAIAHLADARGWTHYVVVYQVKADTLLLMDPASGELRRTPTDEFSKQWTGVLLLLAPAARPPESSRSRSTSSLVRFWVLASPHRGRMLRATLGAAAYTVLGLSTAVFVQKVVDYVIPDGNRDLLDLLTVSMVLLLSAQIYFRCAKDLLVLRTGQSLDAALIHGYYRHLLSLPQSFFDTMRVGEIVSRLNDAVKIRVFVNETSLELLVNVMVVLFSFALMLLYSWQLATLVAVSIPIYLLVYWISNRFNRREQRRTMEAAAEFEAHLVESVGAVTTIRRLGLEEHSVSKAEHRLVRLLRPVYAGGLTASLSGAAAELVSRATTVALLWLGTLMVLRQTMTPGELMSFYALNGHLTMPVLGLIAANRQVQDALIAADRLFDVMDLEQQQQSGELRLEALDIQEIRFRGVHFRYGSRPPLFRNLNLSIRSSALTALVGESGSGKSTLAALLHRVHEPDTGQVMLGDVDIRHVERRSLLRGIAVVPQEVVLFSGTLLDNLAPGDAEPDISRIGWILERLGLSDLVESLPEALNTPIGERGLSLSGGQRQRIAIARALYRRPGFLILDEATSGLDARTEAIVFRTLRALQAEGVAILLITHRLTSAMNADHILVLADGALREQGTHRELIERGGIYQQLWEHQTGGVRIAVGPDPARSGTDACQGGLPLPAAG